MSRAKFTYVNMHTFVCTDLWNSLPLNFVLLHIQYEITRNRNEISTLTLEQKLMYLRGLILVNKTLERPQYKLLNRND